MDGGIFSVAAHVDVHDCSQSSPDTTKQWLAAPLMGFVFWLDIVLPV